MGTKSGFHAKVKAAKRLAPEELPLDTLVFIDASASMWAVNSQLGEEVAALTQVTPESSGLARLATQYADLLIQHNPYQRCVCSYVFEGLAKKPASEERLHKCAKARNSAYRNAILNPKSNARRLAGLKSLSRCMGRPPTWFVKKVMSVMAERGLNVCCLYSFYHS